MHAASKMPRLRLPDLILAAIAAALALPAVAQQATLSLEQIERKYRRMSIVHIEKCDYDRDGQFTRTEQLCVASVYQAMYLERD